MDEELRMAIRRNQMLGMWAAEKLGLTGPEFDAYAQGLALSTLDPECNDIFSKVRRDFDAAGVIQSDEQILGVMNELLLLAASQLQGSQGGSIDAAAVMLARKLTSR